MKMPCGIKVCRVFVVLGGLLLLGGLLSYRTGLLGEEAPKELAYPQAAYQAAYRMMEASKTPEALDFVAHRMVELQLRAVPAFVDCRAELEEFLVRVMGYQILKKDLAEAYLAEFSVAELKELTTFYQTPLGQKLAESGPRISGCCADLTQRSLQANSSELARLYERVQSKKNSDHEATTEVLEK